MNDCRFAIADCRLPEKRKSKTEIRNSENGLGISSLDFPISIFEFRFSNFGLCESTDN